MVYCLLFSLFIFIFCEFPLTQVLTYTDTHTNTQTHTHARTHTHVTSVLTLNPKP
jgi:hypothetical protein